MTDAKDAPTDTRQLTGTADAVGDECLDTLFRNARTYNGYVDRPVSVDLLHSIWELAKLAPTSANISPARIVWCVSPEAKFRLAELASSTNARKIRSAPVTAIIGMDLAFADKLPQLFPHVDARPWFAGSPPTIAANALRNSSIQGAFLIMAARALGLGAGPMSGFDNERVDEAFFKGTQIRSNFITTLGYGDPETVFPRLPRLSFEEATWTR